MASSDIYEVKEPAWAKKPEKPKRRRRSSRVETFDEAVHKNISATHRRRSHNSGFRRLRHRLKDPKFNKKFWGSILGSGALVLILLVLWDLFLRYPKP
jgi:hypothetical protein